MKGLRGKMRLNTFCTSDGISRGIRVRVAALGPRGPATICELAASPRGLKSPPGGRQETMVRYLPSQ